MEVSSTEGLECHVKAALAPEDTDRERFRSACCGTADYEHDGERYCILHLPTEDKEDDFKAALRKKLKQDDFDFAGVYFPDTFLGDFIGATFGERANFHAATFSGSANFSRAIFSEEANFDRATFNRAQFSETTFSKEAQFFGATFGEPAVFYEATFRDLVSFRHATFNSWAYFHRTTFSKAGLFVVTTFSEGANFSRATFSEGANFDRATFSKAANLSGATFNTWTIFSRNTFSEEANFSGATFSGKANFGGATFKESALFNTLKAFPRTALVFDGANIEKPERISFHTTFLRPSWFVDVDAQKFDFSDVEWFRIPDSSEPNTDQLKTLTLENEVKNLVVVVEGQPEEETRWSPGSRTRSLRKLTKACRRLMNNAEENRDYPTANEFHYWSMEAQRKEGLSRLGLIAALYWALSGYGERPRRAFWMLVALWLAFAALYLLLADTAPFWVFAASDVWEGTDYARQAVVYSLTALARLNPEPKPEELGWFQTLVTLEGILGPVQIALFLLAVRRKVMR